MTGIFFQSIGKSIHAVVASLVRDIACFTPLAIILPYYLESKEAGTGIQGILFAAPIADLVAAIVILGLTNSFFSSLKKETTTQKENDIIMKPSCKGTIITIAREHGSAGKQIGKMVAQKLGIPFYYKEMTALAAQESGLDEIFISEINRNSPSVLHELYLSTNVIQQAVMAQEKIIREIADNGSCVIVGRAADYVLRDYEDVVRIFLYAPKDYRIKNIMEMYGDTKEEAISNIRHSDEARAAYYRNISGQIWGSAHNYDFCLDTSMGREKCADLICSYVKG